MITRGRGYVVAFVALVSGLLVSPAGPARGAEATVQPGFSLVRTATGHGEFNLTDFAFLPAGGMLTIGKDGTVTRVAPNGAITVVARIAVENSHDLGLVGMAIGNDYPQTGWVYALHSYRLADRVFSRLVRWTVDNPAAPSAIVDTTVVVDGIEALEHYHGVGTVIVDIDGTIWFGAGDGSSPNYPDSRAFRVQDLDQPQGKIFHIRPNGMGVADNPFYDESNPTSWRSRVWAYGFRNPFRFSLHPDGTLYIGDVGWGSREEVDIGRKGGNYGWPCLEGTSPTQGYRDMPQCAVVSQPGATVPPLFEYGRRAGIGASVLGGAFMLGDAYPEPYRNSWLFGDTSRGLLWTLETDAQHQIVRGPEAADPSKSDTAFAGGLGYPVAVRANPAGELAVADIVSGDVHLIRHTPGNRAPVARGRADVTFGDRRVELFGSESSDPDGDALSYEWDFGDGSPRAFVADPVHEYPAVDTYTATLKVRDPGGATATQQVTVAIDDHEPTLLVTGPPAEKRFQVGEPLAFTATATDAEDSDLNGDDVTWRADLVHCVDDNPDGCHTHPGRTSTGPQFTLAFPDHGGDNHLEVHARVEDSVGHVARSTYVAQPQLQTLTLTSALGARLLVNGDWVGPDNAATVVAGSRNLLSATPVEGYLFKNWSDAETAPQRAFTMPPVDIALEAVYRPVRIDVGVSRTAGDHRVTMHVSPVGEPGDAYSPVWLPGCTQGPPAGDNGDGKLSVGETWSIPCRVSAGSYPGEFAAIVKAIGPHNAVVTGQATMWLNPGYRMVATDGGIFSFGTGTFYGSTGGIQLNAPIVGMASSGEGYWLVASDGGIFTFGNAPFLGSMGGTPLNKPIVGMAATPSGNGYWLVASDGGIFTFGDAPFLGSMGGTPLNQPIVGMASTPSGNGYFMVASDGGIFTFGDAPFLGSMGGTPLNKPIEGMATMPSGNGYFMVASDGGIFTFGDAQFLGSMGGTPLNQPIVGMALTPGGTGYWMVASDGGIFTFGDGHFLGSMGGTPLNRPVVGMAPSLAP